MEFIDGIELLYSTYHANTSMKIVFWISVVLFSLMFLATLGCIIEEKDWKSLWAPIIFGAFSILICYGCWSNSNAYTVYCVSIDDNVPYNYINETFDDITYQGGDVYKIIIDEK